MTIINRIHLLEDEKLHIYLAATHDAPDERTLKRLRQIREELARLWMLQSRERVRFVDPLNRMVDDTLTRPILADEVRHVVH